MCNVSFNPPRAPLWERKICSAYVRSFFSVMFSVAFPRMRTIFQGVLCTQMFYIIFYVSSPPTLENKFLHYLQTRALHRPCQNISACLFYVRPEAKPNRKKEFCSGDKKVELQRKGHQFSQIPCSVLFIFFVSLKTT